MTATRSEEASPRRQVFVTLVLFGIGGAAVMLALSGWDWLHTHGRPVEHATVLTSVEADGSSSYCRRAGFRPDMLLTWRSSDPPSGLPATFVQRTACDPAQVGETDDIVRVPHADGTASVYLEPATTLSEVGLLTLVGLVGGVVIAIGGALFWRLWHRLRRPRHRA